MVIYTNNLAEKLFGFAMSREQLRETGLCDALEDPNLQLDIDLAIDFNAAVRGDEDAAERFTNNLILSSAFLDYSTADFYTTRMEQYPVFEYHVDRITYIFDNIDNINDYYSSASAREKGFLDSLKNALKDCLNSPCNLFASSSESIASIIDSVAASNTTTMPSLSDLRDLFKTAYGGIKKTVINDIPLAVGNMIGEMAIYSQDAFNQSIDMIYSKDPKKKDKLVADALAGKALDYDSTGYVYVPDIEAITSINGFATAVLSQAAADLGGCFRKYQHLARYSSYDPTQNLSRTNPDPASQTDDQGNSGPVTTGGVGPIDDMNRNLNCEVGNIATPDVAPPGSFSGSSLGSKDQYDRLLRALKDSKLIGTVPADGAKYGITTGSLEEWAQFFTALGNVESGFRYKASFRERNGVMSEGLYSLTVGEKGLTQTSIFNPDTNTKAAISIFEDNFLSSKNPNRYIGNYEGGRWVGGSAYWGPLRTRPDQPVGRDKRESNDLSIKLSDYR